MITCEDYFKKVYHFQNSDLYNLPNEVFVSPKWCVPELQEKKGILNKVKGRLSKYKLKVWSKHTAYRDPSGFVMKKLAETIHPELLTQAWCKFYEILGQFPVVSQEAISTETFTSLHLCEAPGAFVCSLNHYLALNCPNIKWNWIANTLNPNYEGNELSQMIPDDRLIRYTLKNWYFGIDFTGDVTKYYNHTELVKSLGNRKVDLVTSDGSIDCMKDPGEQERHVEFLHFCETINALAVLKAGGTFVLKIFTIFEDTTVNLMFLLNCVFEKVSVFKPCTSKSGNSEVYVISTNFQGFDLLSNVWNKLISVYKINDIFSLYSMFSLSELPEIFLKEIHECVNLFMSKQIRTIKDNIYFFENKVKSESHKVYMLKTSIAQYYITLYSLKWISNEKKLVRNVSIGNNWRVHAVNKIVGLTCIPTENLVKCNLTISIVNIKIGKQIEFVKNSKFMQKDNIQKLSSLFKKSNKTSQGLYSLLSNQLEKNNEVFNVKDFDLRQYCRFQYDFFYTVYNCLGKLSNMIFINIPFHTHFLVAVLYILFHGFEKVYFGNSVIILYKCKVETLKIVKEVLTLVEVQYSKLNYDSDIGDDYFKKDIVQIIPPSFFDETCTSLVGLIWNYNNQIFNKNAYVKKTISPFHCSKT